jgi:hypothetical protein
MKNLMAVQQSAVGVAAVEDAGNAAARRERRFFGGMAWACALTVLAGFLPTYYLNGVAGQAFALTPMLHWHGGVFTAWMLLLVVQTSLIASRRVRAHRTLGAAGMVLAAAMVVLGWSVAITRTQSSQIVDQGVPPLVFLAVPLLGMAVFAGLVVAAVYFRRKSSAAHKRLMLLATFELVTAAVSRLPWVEEWGPLGFFAVTDLFVAALVVYDFASEKRIHRATLWGGLAFVASQPLRLAIGPSAPWLAFAGWLTT